jgi:hypothetical protein
VAAGAPAHLAFQRRAAGQAAITARAAGAAAKTAALLAGQVLWELEAGPAHADCGRADMSRGRYCVVGVLSNTSRSLRKLYRWTVRLAHIINLHYADNGHGVAAGG